MAAMLVNFALMLCLTVTFEHMVRDAADNPPQLWHDLDLGNQPLRQKTLDPNNPPQQWQDLVTFVNRRIEGMERLLTEKDERIDNLELTIAEQTTEIKRLKQGMTSLEKKVSEKNEVVDKLEAKVSDLERVMTSKSIPRERESRQTKIYPIQRTENGTRHDLGTTSDIRLGPSVKQMFPSKSSVPKTSIFEDADVMLPQSKQEIQNVDSDSPDQSGVDNTAENNENNFENSGIRQKRVAPPTPSTKTTIAFHAAISNNKAVKEDVDVVYDQELLDIGDGYSSREGMYTVPESGTYVITWTTICSTHSYFQTVLMVNGAVRGSSWTDAQEVGDLHQTTAVVVLTLNQGDHVFIRMGHTYGHGTIISNDSTGKSTLSGWKLN